MPRIRTLKPEHRQHRKVGPLSNLAYRLWVGMILEADDDGRLVADPQQLRVIVFGYHADVTTENVEDALDEIETPGLIRRYIDESSPSGSRVLVEFPSWADHQRIDKYRPSILPGYESSQSGHGAVVESSSNAPGLLAHEVEGKGSEGNGKEQDMSSARRTRRNDAREVLRFLNEKASRSYRETDANLKLIEARLQSGATVANCKGIIARKIREWTEPKMTRYLRPETLFNATKFESYLGEREPDGAV